MSEQRAATESVALSVVAAAVALVVVAVIALAIARVVPSTAPKPLALPVFPILEPETGPFRIQFTAGSDLVSDASREVLSRVAVQARRDQLSVVSLTSQADRQTALLTGRRLDAVRHALEANGVPAENIRKQMRLTAPGRSAETSSQVELELRQP